MLSGAAHTAIMLQQHDKINTMDTQLQVGLQHVPEQCKRTQWKIPTHLTQGCPCSIHSMLAAITAMSCPAHPQTIMHTQCLIYVTQLHTGPVAYAVML